jgi:hypothetical protein
MTTNVKLSQISTGGAFNTSTDKVVAVRNGTSDVLTTLGTSASYAASAFAQTSNNLSDLANAATARTNLGLGSASTQNTSAFLQPSNNLSDISNVATTRTNLGLNTPEVSITAASTVDLGTAGSPNILVNGSATITSFGSSASTNATDYIIRFNGNVTITNSSSLLCPYNTNLTLVATDYIRVRYLGSGNWIVLDVFPFSSGGTITLGSNPNLVLNAGALSINATIYNVKDYGAKGDGVTNDNTAIAACIAACVASSFGGIVYFPQGKYIVTQQFTATISAGQSLFFRGDGPGVSKLLWTASSGGFSVTYASGVTTSGYIGASGLSFQNATANGGNALTLISNNAPNPGPVKRVFDCAFGGSGSGYWTYCINLDAGTFVSILDCWFAGASSGGSFVGSGINMQNSQQSGGTNIAVDNFITSCHFIGVNIGINIGSGYQGIYIDQVAMVGSVEGIVWSDTTPQATLLKVIGCHINSITHCIYTVDVTSLLLQGNLFLSWNSGPWVGIYINNTVSEGALDTNVICNNIIETTSGSSGNNGIVLQKCSYSMICNNIIGGIDSGIWIQDSASTNNIIKNNQITNFNTAAVTDSGAKSNIISALAGYGALIYQTSTQSLSNATATTITYNSANYDPLSMWNGSTTLTVPAGVSKVRVTASIQMAGGGPLAINIRKNNTTFPGQPNQSISATTGATGLTTTTPVLNVSAGDAFTVVVTQSSGGSMNTGGGNTCWLSMEIIG